MQPRPQEKNEPLQITRHVVERRNMLVPGEELNNLLGYVLGWAQARSKMKLSVFAALLDRVQMTAFDAECTRSSFMRDFFGTIARALNLELDRQGSQLWGPRDHDGATPILDKEEMIEAMAEVVAAPAIHDLVDRPTQWIGLSFGPDDWGKTFTFTRPDFFFSDKMPETVTVTVEPPPGFEEEGVDALRERVEQRARELVEEARRRRRAAGRKVLGRKGLRKIVAGSFPRAPHPQIRRRHFRTSDGELAGRATRRLRIFFQAHREAKRQMLLRLPERDYQFPPETYWWRKWSDAPCAPRRERTPFAPP